MSAAVGGETPDHLGHRDRLRARLLEAGPGALADYELLELLLFAAIPRQDTKSVAKSLIDRFGGLAGVFNADPEALRQVKGVKDTAIGILKVVPAAAARMLEREVAERPVLNSWQKVLDYCRVAMAYAPIEEFRVLFLDRKNMLIRAEIQQRGTIDQTPVYPREVVKRALELGASALILVHNHPSGDPTPSRADIEMTKAVFDAARSLGIELHDHLVIGRHGHASLKGLGHF